MFNRIITCALLTLSLLASPLAFAAKAPPFTAGKEYEIITKPVAENPLPKGKVQVIEFFSYGCHACNHLEPAVENWLKHLPKYVDFQRVPVIFEPGWHLYAQVYYTAKALNNLPTITPAFFRAIHDEGDEFNSQEQVEEFFIKQGVTKIDFESAFQFAPGIEAQIMHGDSLMRAYAVMQIPTFIINGKYKTNIAMTGGDSKKFFQLIDYLIRLERQKKS